MLTQAQVYIEKHKITALFEDLMNKLVRNAPENPVIYLIKQLYKKAGLHIPEELKSTIKPRRNSLSLTVFGHSSEIVSKSVALASWSAKPGEPHSTPFLRKEKSLNKSWQTPEKQKTSGEVHFSKTTKPVKGQKSDDKKDKTGWNSLTKITSSTFDEFSKQTKGSPSKTKVESFSKTKDIRKSWAMSAHDEADNRETSYYMSPTIPQYTYRHNKNKLNEEALFSDELPSTPSLKSYTSQESDDTFSYSTYTSRRGNCKAFNSQKHKAELERLIMNENQVITPESTLMNEDEETDGAIELLENPTDLESEGVSSISSAGFKLSKTLRQREDSQVKLNIKLFPSASDVESMTSQSNCFHNHRRHIDQESLATSYKFDDSDEEIESASQVSANINRKYEWNSPDSEEDYVNSPSSKPYLDKEFPSKSLSSLQISQNYMIDDSSNPKPNSSVPLPTSPMSLLSKKQKKHEPYQQESQLSLNREQLEKLKTNSSGWNVVAESDTSILSSHTNRF